MMRISIYFPRDCEQRLVSTKKSNSGGTQALLKIAELGKSINAKGLEDISTNLDAYLVEIIGK